MEPKIICKKEGGLLTFERLDNSKKVRYNLITKQMEKLNRKGNWEPTQAQYVFFRGISMEEVQFTDPKFAILVKESARENDNCRSISSFVARLDAVLIYESYIHASIGFSKWHKIKRSLSWYPRPAVQFFKTAEIEVDKYCEDAFYSQPKIFLELTAYLLEANFSIDSKKRLFLAVVNDHQRICSLITEYKYDLRSLVDYLLGYLLPFENLGPDESARILVDYYRMGVATGRHIDKYPKYLKSMHDIMEANYQQLEKEHNEQLFAARAKPQLEHAGRKYSIVIPKGPKDVLAEGAGLNHCVSSYIDDIINGNTYILFLRYKELPEKPLVTVEVKAGTVVQAKGAYNRKLVEEEAEYLKLWAAEKELQVRL